MLKKGKLTEVNGWIIENASIMESHRVVGELVVPEPEKLWSFRNSIRSILNVEFKVFNRDLRVVSGHDVDGDPLSESPSVWASGFYSELHRAL